MSIENAKLVQVPINHVSAEQVLAIVERECETAFKLATKAAEYDCFFDIPVIISEQLLGDNEGPFRIKWPSEAEIQTLFEPERHDIDVEVAINTDDFPEIWVTFACHTYD